MQIRQEETLSHQGAIIYEVCCSSAQWLPIWKIYVSGETDHFLQFENSCFQVKRTIVTTREPFPDVLQWFPILDDPEVFDMTPLDNAIEKMDETNKEIEILIQEYTRPNANPSINPLTQKLKGIIGKDTFFTHKKLNYIFAPKILYFTAIFPRIDSSLK